jgi:hypothetical protein
MQLTFPRSLRHRTSGLKRTCSIGGGRRHRRIETALHAFVQRQSIIRLLSG